jgi:anti-sigma regulatory factor (Ser/Thr protein kinase)
MNRWPRRPGVVLEREYDGTTGTLRAARTDVTACLHDYGVDENLRERAELVLSELAANAVQASPGSPFGLRMTVSTDGSVVVAVTSHTNNGSPPPREQWGPVTVRASSGRGLMIVDHVSERVVVDKPDPRTVVVTATLR